MPSSVVVKTGSRIHFGLYPIEVPNAPSSEAEKVVFAGLGAAIDSPGFEIEFCESDRLRLQGSYAERAHQTLQNWLGRLEPAHPFSKYLVEQLPVAVDVQRSIPAHCGFGSGTQFDLAMIRGLEALFELDGTETLEMSTRIGRGARSLVGTRAFAEGGLVFDDQVLKQLQENVMLDRLEVPEHWRILTLVPSEIDRICGTRELKLFNESVDLDMQVGLRMRSLVINQIQPAVRSGEFKSFAAGIEAFGELAGSLFRTAQDGTYRRGFVESSVATLRHLGVSGVGQSSWGPGVFCWFENDEQANRFLNRHRKEFSPSTKITLSTPLNCGASCCAKTDNHSGTIDLCQN